ncbi:PLD nuclease N-terminal domain-containing protein [Cellulomonas sp. NPDC089187]|uniref:PLD nuclease N-terminal domain-containing protein n=1 Tax=Cellulomonas sp. NPDC089187 TaxID=3154970 RepID=UPI00343DA97F
MARVLLFLLIIALAVYAAVDVTNSEEHDRRGLPAGLWLVIVVVFPVIGPILWFMVSRSQRAARAGGPSSGGGAGRPSAGPTRPQRGPVAPDDDPDFLWRLEQEQRRRKREQEGGSAPSGDQSPE